jgi:hypothetical protein
LNDHQIELLDAPSDVTIQGDTLQLNTGWRNKTGPVPLKIYIHLLDASGQIVAQWDGLDIAWEGWHSGDVLWQRHEIPLPTDLSPGQYELRTGLYDPAAGDRWQTAAGTDFAPITAVEIVP